MKTILTLILLLNTDLVEACSVCFYGDPSETANVALRSSIITLLAVLAILLGLFIKFFINVGRRSKLSNKINQ